jgi:uncharacterized protein
MLAVVASIVIAIWGLQAPANSAPADAVGSVKRAPLTAADVSALQADAEKGDVSAELKLARAYSVGDGVARSAETAADWYRKAADHGNSEAQNEMGMIYSIGDGVVRDKALAVTWYRKAARQGYAEAMVNLGKAYYNGDGVPVDDASAFAWFTLAKEAGDPNAAKALENTAGDRKPWTEADGYKHIAELYGPGGLLGANPTTAARWWLLSAQGGDTEAQVMTADNFLNGHGVPQNLAAGRHWCEEAAKFQDFRSFYCLGEIYRRGLGVKPNYTLARSWYERSARQRSAESVRALAEMDAAGQGGKRNLESASVRYASLVVSVGDKGDAIRLAALKSQIPPKRWKEVEKQLTAMHIDPEKLDQTLKSASAQ